jgi:hypothetical protein
LDKFKINWNPPLSNIYHSEFEVVAKQAYSMWNREPASPSFGSFDRTYWGWKYKDFSDATLQYAVKLAVEYSKMVGMTSVLPALLEAYVAYCQRLQLKDGSFDQCYPNERTPGVIYDILSVLIYVRQLPYLDSPKAQRELDGVIERAVTFALRAEEKHGEIANHLAKYAYELLHYAIYAKDDRARLKGERYIGRLLSLLDDEEGWFQEYQGPDPGYQTRTLRYLTKCALLLEEPNLWESVLKAADFIDAVLMPDGSIHPMLGTRSTALLYPSAFEILASRYESYERLATRIRDGWRRALVPLPSWLDFDNAIRLGDDALDAWRAFQTYKTKSLEHEQNFDPTELIEEFPNAGILIYKSRNRVVYVGYGLGGSVIIYAKCDDAGWQLLHEDSGYLLRFERSEKAWITRMPNSGVKVESSKDRLFVRAHFYRSLHEELTTVRLILLRILNMTVLRWHWIGDLFRKIVVNRIISRRERISITLSREVVIRPDNVRISDQIIDERPSITPSQRGLLYRCRRLSGTHMASSRYFQEQELQNLRTNWMEKVPWEDEGHAISVVEVPSKTESDPGDTIAH